MSKTRISLEWLNCINFDDVNEGNSRNHYLLHVNTEKIICLNFSKGGKHNASLVIKFYSRLGAKRKAKNIAFEI